jgi:1,4-alpha-glucan branching enzyme
LLDYPLHQGAQRWTHDLNTLYRTHPEFYELDYDPAGFEWIDCKDVDNSILIMMRLGKPRPHPDASPVGDGVGAPGARDARPTGLSANEIARGWHHRLDGDGSRPFSIIACNFTPIVRHGYAIGMPRPGKYREVLNSDDRKYGGSGVINEGVFETRPWRVHEREQAILVTLPPLGVAILEQAPEQGRAT